MAPAWPKPYFRNLSLLVVMKGFLLRLTFLGLTVGISSSRSESVSGEVVVVVVVVGLDTALVLNLWILSSLEMGSRPP